jgi:hypothetical protein
MVAGRTIRIGVGLAPALRAPAEPSSTLTDPFDDNSRDTGLWDLGALKTSGSAAVTVNEANARLEITANASAAGYGGYISRGIYDLTNSNISCKVTVVGAMAAQDEGYIGAGQDSSNYYIALVGNGNLFLQRNAAGSAGNVGTVAYSGTTHAWLRLRFDGTTVYLDTATSSASNPPIESDWTNRFSEARNAAINLTSTRIAIDAGAFGAGSTAAFQFDGFNTATAAAASAIAATAAITEADDSVSSAAALAIAAAASTTEGNDSLSSAAAVAIAAALGKTEAGDTVGAAGAVAIAAALASTEAADSVSSAATLAIKASAAITEGADTLSASAGSGIAATLAVTEADDTVSALGALALLAAFASTEASDTLSATGHLGSSLVAAILTVTEEDDRLIATGRIAPIGLAALDRRLARQHRGKPLAEWRRFR